MAEESAVNYWEVRRNLKHYFFFKKKKTETQTIALLLLLLIVSSRNTAMSRLTLVKRLYSHPASYATNLCSTRVHRRRQVLDLALVPDRLFEMKRKSSSSSRHRRKDLSIVVSPLRSGGISGVYRV